MSLLGAHARHLTRDKQFLLGLVAKRLRRWPTYTSSGLFPSARGLASIHTAFRGCCSPAPPFDDTFGPGFPVPLRQSSDDPNWFQRTINNASFWTIVGVGPYANPCARH